jgi:protein SCO1
MRPPEQRRRLPVALAIAVVALLAPTLAGCGSDETAATGGLAGGEPSLAGVVREPPLQVGDVVLPDAASGGAPMAMRAPEGELVIVYFGYTTCPDVCPMTMSDIRGALDDLPEGSADRVTVAMATVDPERDRDDKLIGYLGHFFDRSAALRTDDPAQLDAAASAFGVQYEVEDHEPGEATYEVAHSAITYVVDDTGTVLVEWPFGFERKHMAADLSILLDTREKTS